MEVVVDKHAIPLVFPVEDVRIGDPLYTTNLAESFTIREEWLYKKGMFAFVAKEWTTKLAAWIGERKCLEVMSGAGWLAKALREEGVDIIATDNMSWAQKKGWDLVTDIEELDCVKAVTKYGKDIDILIISWPYMDNNAYKTIKRLHTINPDALIVYIGEGMRGCTASDAFFMHFEEVKDPEFTPVQKHYRSWPGIHDRPILGKYKTEETD